MARSAPLPDRRPGVAASRRPAASIGAAYDPVDGDSAGPDWRRMAGVVWRYRWIVLAVTVAGTLAAAAVTHVLRPPYAAGATIWINQDDGRGTVAGPAPTVSLLDAEAWLDLARSYVVLDDVVRDLRLYLAPERAADSVALRDLAVSDSFRPGRYVVSRSGSFYVLRTRDGAPMDRAPVGDSLGRDVGLRWAPAPEAIPAGRAIAFALVTPRDAARQLAGALETRIDRNGHFLHVDLEGASPRGVAAVVNAVARRYVQVAEDLKRQKLTELTDILRSQTDYAEKSLRAAEAAYASYRVHTITQPGESEGDAATPNPLADDYFRMALEQSEARHDRAALARLLRQAGDSGIDAEPLALVPAVQHDAELSRTLDSLRAAEATLRALRLRYADAYLPVQRAAQHVRTLRRDILPGLTQSLITALDTRIAMLDSATTRSASALRRIPPRAVEEARLKRNLTGAQELYASIRRRYQEATLAVASSVPDARILDAAVPPERPVRDTRLRLMALSLLGSFGVAVLGVLLVDRGDPKVRYPEQVSLGMGLPILGAMPHLHGPKPRRSADATIAAVEALRGVRLNLLYAHGPGPLALTITSAGSGDGKSFLTANLGLSFAEAGLRTLVVDGDTRRGSLHRGLGVQRCPGLVDLLAGEATETDVVRPTRYPGLFLLPSGARRRDAPERIASSQAAELLANLRSQFDVVLCDSPPLSAGIDSYALAAASGRALLVVRPGVTHREMAEIKLRVFDRLPVELVGAVLNDVPWGSVFENYGYYLPGYEATDEDADAGVRRLV